jgi:hypothetical protein
MLPSPGHSHGHGHPFNEGVIRLAGSPKVLCDGITRRDLLHVGGLSVLGLSVAGWQSFTRLQAADTTHKGSGRAKACILLYLFGSPAQHETFDPKPDAPADIRGEMGAISTKLTGVQIGEGLPRVAGILDRLTVVRSLTHQYPLHGVPYALTGEPAVVAADETKRDASRWPFIGSVVDYLAAQRAGGETPEVPRNVGLPFPIYAHTNYPRLAGPYGGFLGSRYDPVWTSFDASGTREVPDPKAAADARGKPKVTWLDPYAGVNPGDKFGWGAGPAEAAPEDHWQLRRSLLEQFDQSRRRLESGEAVQKYTEQQKTAWALMASNKFARALDIQREPLAIREKYGMHLFGQSALAARRLVEAGSKFVTVFWDAYKSFEAGWDTHYWHYPRLKNHLLPGFDQTYSALILDLEGRGLLDETLVLCLSEHGRTPALKKERGGGRDHWSKAYSAVFAGGGIAKGKVVGQTDRVAGEVRDTPVSPKDILATAYHLLGIDPHTMVNDRLNRPLPVAGGGTVRDELLR